MKAAVFILGALIAPALAKNFGAINVEGQGQVYVVGQDWNGDYVQVDGSSLRLNGGGRVYFATEASDGFSPSMYWQVRTIFLLTILL